MEKTFTQICELFDQFSKDANLQMEKSNKAAGTRARKVSLELENFSNSSEKSHSKHRNNFHSGSDSRKMANFTCTISKKPSSLHSGEASLIMTKLNINYAKFLFRFWKKQLHFRMSVGFHGRIVGNSTFANSDNPLGWYSTLFQFCGNKTCSRYTQRIIDT